MMKTKTAGLILFLIFLTAINPAGAQAMNGSSEKATFAGGGFWGMEKYFSKIPGVISTRVGYTGGTVKNPSYERVCTGTTGHAEAIEVTYDPQTLRYEDLVEFFFRHHDPTTLDRQGPDVGSQYRSAIFTHSPEQAAIANQAKAALDQSGIFKHPIVTEIVPAKEFYSAEDYHQKYLEKNPGGYCSLQVQSKKIGEILHAVWKK